MGHDDLARYIARIGVQTRRVGAMDSSHINGMSAGGPERRGPAEMNTDGVCCVRIRSACVCVWRARVTAMPDGI